MKLYCLIFTFLCLVALFPYAAMAQKPVLDCRGETAQSIIQKFGCALAQPAALHCWNQAEAIKENWSKAKARGDSRESLAALWQSYLEVDGVSVALANLAQVCK